MTIKKEEIKRWCGFEPGTLSLQCLCTTDTPIVDEIPQMSIRYLK